VERIGTVVVGAGVIGLALARELAQAGHDVLIVEAEASWGQGTSSRNSEVLHGGLYYPSGSLKARLCVEGRRLLTRYMDSRSVPWRACGKLIVACEHDELPALANLAAQAERNDVEGLRWLDGPDARALEPELQAMAALHSTVTGILDSHALMMALLADAEAKGAQLVCHTRMLSARQGGMGRWVLELVDTSGTDYQLACDNLVNAAGLGAIPVARRIDALASTPLPSPRYCKGQYFSLSGRSPFQRLIYPLHNAAGLGVHLTLDLAGQARFGPDTSWTDSPDDLAVDASRQTAFESEIRRYWPRLPNNALHPDYAGIRPKLVGPDEAAADFVIDGPEQHGIAGLLNLMGIESPGLTACLAIARLGAARLAQGE
jgi:L-2-hydroxyglutarate oxidase LhgO